jgi:small subunit ribosomal protein S11
MYITSTFNNTLVTVTTQEGNVVCSGSSGTAGFKGARRATPYAATKTVTKLIDDMKLLQVKELEIYLKGAGMGREAALRALKNSGIKLTMIADITPIPHNGVRPKKKRRV